MQLDNISKSGISFFVSPLFLSLLCFRTWWLLIGGLTVRFNCVASFFLLVHWTECLYQSVKL